jgi:hypothetical protein
MIFLAMGEFFVSLIVRIVDNKNCAETFFRYEL